MSTAEVTRAKLKSRAEEHLKTTVNFRVSSCHIFHICIMVSLLISSLFYKQSELPSIPKQTLENNRFLLNSKTNRCLSLLPMQTENCEQNLIAFKLPRNRTQFIFSDTFWKNWKTTTYITKLQLQKLHHGGSIRVPLQPFGHHGSMIPGGLRGCLLCRKMQPLGQHGSMIPGGLRQYDTGGFKGMPI